MSEGEIEKVFEKDGREGLTVVQIRDALGWSRLFSTKGLSVTLHALVKEGKLMKKGDKYYLKRMDDQVDSKKTWLKHGVQCRKCLHFERDGYERKCGEDGCSCVCSLFN